MIAFEEAQRLLDLLAISWLHLVDQWVVVVEAFDLLVVFETAVSRLGLLSEKILYELEHLV